LTELLACILQSKTSAGEGQALETFDGRVEQCEVLKPKAFPTDALTRSTSIHGWALFLARQKREPPHVWHARQAGVEIGEMELQSRPARACNKSGTGQAR